MEPRFLAGSWAGTRFPVILFVLACFQLWLAAVLPPAEDELYYWTWSHSLQLSYFDHSPLIAYLIRLSTALFGNSIIAIRLPAILCGITVLYLIYRQNRKAGIMWGLLAVPVFLLGSLLMTPDLPLAVFWVLYLTWITRVHQDFARWGDDPVTRVYRTSPVPLRQWALGGIVLGLGLLSKYTMALAVPCSFLLLFFRYRYRSWVWGYLFHLVIAGLLFTPVFLYNLKYDFAPILFQLGRIGAHSGLTFSRWPEFYGVQILLFSGLPYLFLPWILLRMRTFLDDPQLRPCLFFFLVPLVFFAFKLMRTPLEANWTLVTYLSFWPLAQRLLDENSFRNLGRVFIFLGFAPAWVTTIALASHSIKPLDRMPIPDDRIYRFRAQEDLARRIVHKIHTEAPGVRVWGPSYQWVSYLLYFGTKAEQWKPGSRISEFSLQSRDICKEQTALILSRSIGTPDEPMCFSRKEFLGEYPLVVRGVELDRLVLTRYMK